MPRPINPRLRDDLLDAAILLLERQGPSFSVRDLSAEIDYSATAVYRCFASRGDLLKAVQVRLFVELVTELMPPSPCDEAVSAQILDLGRRFVVWGVDHPVRYTFMFQNVDPDALLDEHERNIARAPSRSCSPKSPSCSNCWSARLLALNSTGSVRNWSSSAPA